MTVGERIGLFISEQGLKKVEFAAAVNIDQSYVTKIIKGTSAPSERLLADISKKFGIRFEWLKTGAGEMFIQRNLSLVEQLATEFNLTEQERELITNFLSLPPDVRDMVAQAVSRAAKLYPRKPDTELNRAEMHEMLDDELDDREAAKKEATTTWSASTPTSGSSKKFGKPIA